MGKHLTPIDLSKNELQNARIQNLAAPPSAPVPGLIYFDTTLNRYGGYNNSTWTYKVNLSDLGVANGVATLNASSLVVQNPASAALTAAAAKIPLADGSGKIDTSFIKTGTGNGLDADTVDGYQATALLARASHTGTQAASTISDLASVVKAYPLSEFAAPTSNVNLNSKLITNVLDPVSPQDAATKNYVDNSIQGLNIKTQVRAASAGSNLTLSGAQTIDGISVITGDRVLVKDQTTATQNGIYIVAAGAWSRAADMDTWAECINAFCFISQGTVNADTGWVSTVDIGGTLGVTPINYIQFSAAGQISATNLGTLGIGVFSAKAGTVLQFKNIAATSTKIAITADANNNILVDVAEANLTHNNIGGILGVAKGGTGASTLTGYVKAAGTSVMTASNTIPGSDISGNITGNATNITGTAAVANGGTGATSLTGYVKGSGTNAMTASSTIPGSDISGNITGNAANVTGVVAISNGGTGQSTPTTARVALGATGKFAQTIGNGSLTSFTINHGLNTMDIGRPACWEVAAPYNLVELDFQLIDANNILAIFAVAPTTNQYRVVITG